MTKMIDLKEKYGEKIEMDDYLSDSEEEAPVEEHQPVIE